MCAGCRPQWRRFYREYIRYTAFAHGLVAKAIKRGFIAALAGHRCADCGEDATIYEHRDYERPLDVVPMCASCNVKRGPAVQLSAFVQAHKDSIGVLQ